MLAVLSQNKFPVIAEKLLNGCKASYQTNNLPILVEKKCFLQLCICTLGGNPECNYLKQEMSQSRDECPQRNWSSIRQI